MENKISLAITITDNRSPIVPESDLIDDVVIIRDIYPALLAKRCAVEVCKNGTVVLMDSDNEMGSHFFDLTSLNQMPDVIYCPVRSGSYDFSEFAGKAIHANNIREYIDNANFIALLLSGNYTFQRDFYLAATTGDHPEVYAADCMYIHYLWLKAGGMIFVCPGLEYKHNINPDGYFARHYHESWEVVEDLKRKILALENFE